MFIKNSNSVIFTLFQTNPLHVSLFIRCAEKSTFTLLCRRFWNIKVLFPAALKKCRLHKPQGSPNSSFSHFQFPSITHLQLPSISATTSTQLPGASIGFPGQVHCFLLEWSTSCEKREGSQTQEAVATADTVADFGR